MKNKNDFDINIINELNKLKVPMKTFQGTNVYFENNKRGETIFQHFANKKHQFKVRDIKLLPVILLDSKSYKKDKKSTTYRVYFGRRTGTNKKPYIKIVTKINRNKDEEIVTVYTVRKKC